MYCMYVYIYKKIFYENKIKNKIDLFILFILFSYSYDNNTLSYYYVPICEMWKRKLYLALPWTGEVTKLNRWGVFFGEEGEVRCARKGDEIITSCLVTP